MQDVKNSFYYLINDDYHGLTVNLNNLRNTILGTSHYSSVRGAGFKVGGGGHMNFHVASRGGLH